LHRLWHIDWRRPPWKTARTLTHHRLRPFATDEIVGFAGNNASQILNYPGDL
jgi:hypothetical protein